jgi:hypothetical protein
VPAVALAAAAFLAAASVALAGSAPPNDNLTSGPIVLAVGLNGPYNNLAATSETGENIHPNALGPGCTGPTPSTCMTSVWFDWIAPGAPLGNQGTYTITTCDGGSPFDSTIALYANGAAFPLTLIKGDDNAPTGAPGRVDFSSCTPDYTGTTDEDPANSSITFTATPGVTYKLAVAGAAAGQGGFGIQIFNGYDTLFTDARAGGAAMHAGDTVHSRDVSFSYASVEPNGVSPSHTYKCRLKHGSDPAPALAPCPPGAQTYSGLADGAYTFEVADDTDPTSTTFVFTVAGPVASGNSGLGGAKALAVGAGQVKIAIAGAKSAGVATVNKKGVAKLKTKIDCRPSTVACAYKDAVSGALPPNGKRKKKPKAQKLGGFSGKVKAGKEANAKIKLNKTAMNALKSKSKHKSKGTLKVKVKISVKAAAGAAVSKTVSATLRLAGAGT